jgi:hypothetical protein
MAADKSKSEEAKREQNAPGAPEVSNATDGGDSRLTKGYKDNPDKPDPTSIAQVEELHDEEPGG